MLAELLIFEFHRSQPLVLLLLDLLELFEVAHELTKNLVFLELAALQTLALETVDVELKPLDFLSLALFFVLHVVDFFVALADFLLQLGNFVDLVVRHPQSCSVTACFVEDLRDELFALLN